MRSNPRRHTRLMQLLSVVVAIAATLVFAKLTGQNFMGQMFGDNRTYHTDYFIVFVVAYVAARGLFALIDRGDRED